MDEEDDLAEDEAVEVEPTVISGRWVAPEVASVEMAADSVAHHLSAVKEVMAELLHRLLMVVHQLMAAVVVVVATEVEAMATHPVVVVNPGGKLSRRLRVVVSFN